MTDAGASAERVQRGRARQSPLWAYLNLAVLWTFAVAQPLFDLLKDNPEFFAARGSSGFDVISFSLLLVLLPPAVLLAVELLVGLAGAAARSGAHLAFIAALVALIAAQALKKAFDSSDLVLIVLSVAIGVGVAVLYARAEPVRSFLQILSPAPVVFLALFLFTNPISKIAFPDEAQARTIGGVTQAPIVVVLLDELPSYTLEDDRGRIDAERYPGFAELARSATWFKNAYTVYDSTERAQPAIMDGNLPSEDKLPTSSDHPNSIFSLFAKTHRMNVSEEATSICSRDICTDERLDEGYGEQARVDDRGSRARLAARGLATRHRGRPGERVRELGQLRRRRGGAGPRRRSGRAPHAREPERRPPGALRALDRGNRCRSQAAARLQAHAAPACALAVPARRATLPAPGKRRHPGPVQPGLRVPISDRRPDSAPLPAGRLCRPRAAGALEAPEGGGALRQGADRCGRRPWAGLRAAP